MRTLEDQMSVYAAYHQDGRNKATHFVGVPAIIVGILIPMAWARFEVAGIPLTLAAIFAAVVLAYYYMLDLSLGVTMTVVIALLLYAADAIALQPKGIGAIWFALLFVGGWILQLVGHGYEGRKPALVDNLFQIFVAPIFLAAEVFFALGLKKDLHERVQRRALEMRAAAGIGAKAAA